MLKFRAVSFPLLLALFALMIFWRAGGWCIFLVVATGAVSLLTYELMKMLEKLGIPGMPRTAAVAAGVTVASVILRVVMKSEQPDIGVVLVMILPLLMLLRLLAGGDKAAFLRRLFPGVGAVYLVLLIYLPAVMLFPYNSRDKNAAFLFLFFVLTTKAMDTGGYVFGLLSNRLLPGGNHKIAPTISPKKSWEGFFGGILLALAAAEALRLYPDAPASGWWKPLIVALLLALGSFFGDLTESALKRAAGVKDSGNYIPGMGGAFDVLDSFIYNGWLFVLIMPLLLS